MSNQRTLFDTGEQYDCVPPHSNRPMYRTTDPDTSRMAAAEHSRTGRAASHRAICSQAVHDYPGWTSDELQDVIELSRHEIARRLPECTDIYQGEKRPSRKSGRMAVTWWPVTS